ncbi:transposase [Streptomyces noursei]|uniref:transposase n=1 Tax=Streptomyces noursei TaxID=1971 RepID=UPI00135210AD
MPRRIIFVQLKTGYGTDHEPPGSAGSSGPGAPPPSTQASTTARPAKSSECPARNATAPIRPNGKTTSNWREDRSQQGAAVVRARFLMSVCRPCSDREQCTRAGAKSSMGRRIALRPQAEQEVIQQARAQEDTQERKERYAHRAGVEGTISQGVRAFGLRRCRYHGLAKARLQHQFTATAMNFHRLNGWWTDIPRACTRTSHLAALRPAE